MCPLFEFERKLDELEGLNVDPESEDEVDKGITQVAVNSRVINDEVANVIGVDLL